MLNGNGDLLDLISAVSPKSRPDFDSMTKEEAMSFVAKSGRCSALIKVGGNYSL